MDTVKDALKLSFIAENFCRIDSISKIQLAKFAKNFRERIDNLR